MSSSQAQQVETAPPPPETQDDGTLSSDDTESESSAEETMLQLAQIPTLSQLYKNGALKAAASGSIKHKPNKELLDRVSLLRGDITTLEVDSIVNAANRSLLGGGGVDGAIHRAAGPRLLDECRTLDGCDTGFSKITRGYNLPSSHVIHTVGPVYSESKKDEKAALLKSCYQTSLELAVANSLRHIAFPSISTGIYGYPIQDATRIALETVHQFLSDEENEAKKRLERVIFVVFPPKDEQVYQELLPEYFPSEE